MKDTYTKEEVMINKVYEALGEASMCWEYPEKAGIFDSTKAKEIGEKLEKFIISLLEEQRRACHNAVSDINSYETLEFLHTILSTPLVVESSMVVLEREKMKSIIFFASEIQDGQALDEEELYKAIEKEFNLTL
jgi:hypothetical protein